MYPENLDNSTKNLEEFEKHLREIQERAFTIKDILRERQNIHRNKRRTPQDIQFEVGDYGQIKRRKKINLTWIGPVQITKITSKNLYEITDCQGKVYEVHSVRLKFHCKPKDLLLDENIKEVFLHNRGQFYIKKNSGLDYKDNKFILKCHWHGLEDTDTSWEDFEILSEEIPDMVFQLLKGESKKNESAKFLT